LTELAKIPLAGVMGHPVAHSKSPQLFRHWLDSNGLAGHYVPLHVSPDAFETTLRAMPGMGFVGANVTIPHKQRAMELANHVTERATRIGAANTLTFQQNGEIHADNTDGFGFLENLRQNAPHWRPEGGAAVVLGAGGAARAVLVSLLDAGVPRIILANRTRSRADDLAQSFGPAIEVIDWADLAEALPEGVSVINTTSLGMSGKAPLTLDLSGLHKDQVVTDLVYSPLETDLLRAASKAGCHTVDGLGMLLYQAVPGFERWFGVTPVVTPQTRKAVLA